MPFTFEARFRQHFHCPFHIAGGHDKIDILRHHRFRGPVIDRNSSNCAPLGVVTFQAIHQTHYVVGAAGSLPIVELLCGHGLTLPEARQSVSFFHTSNQRCKLFVESHNSHRLRWELWERWELCELCSTPATSSLRELAQAPRCRSSEARWLRLPGRRGRQRGRLAGRLRPTVQCGRPIPYGRRRPARA